MKALSAIASAAIAFSIVAAASGCGKCPEGGSLTKKAGEKVEDALKIKVSVERQTQIKIVLADAAAAQGLSMNVAKTLPSNANGSHGLTAYLLSKTPLQGQLLAKALGKDGKEIGRANSDFELGSDDAKYFSFWFPSEMDFKKVDSYLIDLKR